MLLHYIILYQNILNFNILYIIYIYSKIYLHLNKFFVLLFVYHYMWTDRNHLLVVFRYQFQTQIPQRIPFKRSRWAATPFWCSSQGKFLGFKSGEVDDTWDVPLKIHRLMLIGEFVWALYQLIQLGIMRSHNSFSLDLPTS